jgi:hypothetical protein
MSMRWPFLDPPQDEISGVASDLIARFGPQARDEALYLAEVAEKLGAKKTQKNRRLFRLAAREIQKRLVVARVDVNTEFVSSAAA